MIYDAENKPHMGIQLAPDTSHPTGRTARRSGLHLDLYVKDIKSAHDEATSLGAILLKAAEDLEAEDGFQVYADPAGHPFCLCWI